MGDMDNSAVQLLDLGPEETVLVVVAHPDDPEYGISSAVAKWSAAGVQTNYLLLTAGEAGIGSVEPSTTGPMRSEEQKAACQQVGVENLNILDFPDGVLEYSLDIRRAIATEIRRVKPTIVITMTWAEETAWGLNQADHRVAGLATLDAIRDAGNKWVFTDVLEPWQASKLMVYGTPNPTHAVDVTGAPIQQGIASLEQHREYLAALPDHPAPSEMIPKFARMGGDMVGVEHAVAFRVYDM